MSRAAKQGGGGWEVLTPPEFWMRVGGGGGVEHLSTPPDYEKKFFWGAGLAPLKLI